MVDDIVDGIQSLLNGKGVLMMSRAEEIGCLSSGDEVRSTW